VTTVTIAIDAMGGDFGPPVTVPAALAALKLHANLHVILVGDADLLQDHLQDIHYDTSRLTIQHASQSVSMDEAPSQALRSKKDSSMRVAINLVKEDQAAACVSAGNTGALMMTARFVLKTLPGIDRPAIVSAFPTLHRDRVVRVLDLGANVDSTPTNLLQFAVMGSVLASTIGNIDKPKVCLLNIGEEEIKGNELVKETANLLTQTNIVNYTGFIEGDQIFQGEADVIVCDGFIGNITLKSMEGAIKLMKTLLKESFMRNIFTKLIALLAKPILKSFAQRLDPGNYNGAAFLGLQGIVIKSHGGANIAAFTNAIEEAMKNVAANIPERIRHEVESLLNQS
jgi:glycerol-3-phosphate acyltransferase PlsX